MAAWHRAKRSLREVCTGCAVARTGGGHRVCQPRPQSLASGATLQTGVGSGERTSGVSLRRLGARPWSSGRNVGPALRDGAVPRTASSLRHTVRERWALAPGAPQTSVSVPRWRFPVLAAGRAGLHPCRVLHRRGTTHAAVVSMQFCPPWARLGTISAALRGAITCIVTSPPPLVEGAGPLASRQLLAGCLTGLAFTTEITWASHSLHTGANISPFPGCDCPSLE